MNRIRSVFDIIDFNIFCIQELMYFNVLRLNKRSVIETIFYELYINLNESKAKFSIIGLSETCILPDENHSILEGYTSYAVCRNCNRNNRGGGLLVYVLVAGMSKKSLVLSTLV